MTARIIPELGVPIKCNLGKKSMMHCLSPIKRLSDPALESNDAAFADIERFFDFPSQRLRLHIVGRRQEFSGNTALRRTGNVFQPSG